MGVAKGKSALRRHYRTLREELGQAARSRMDRAVARRVMGLASWEDSSVVYAYLSFGTEVDTHSLIMRAWAHGKTVVLPRCVTGTCAMRWYRVRSLANLAPGAYEILEPIPDPQAEADPAGTPDSLALVPALAFDMRGYRLGYGGGFYDAFLSGFAGASVGLCRETQLCERIETLEPHDVPVGCVVTESRTIHPALSLRSGILEL